MELNEAQQLVQASAREIARRTLAPIAAELDRSGEFPEAPLRELARLGLMGVNVPARYGGAEAGVVAYSLALRSTAEYRGAGVS